MGRGGAAAADDILYGSFISEGRTISKPTLQRWHGAFEAGHLPSEMVRILPALEEALGIKLCCVWDEYDRKSDDIDQAYHGQSELGILDVPWDESVFRSDRAVKVFKLSQDLSAYLYQRAAVEPEYPAQDSWSQEPILNAGERLVFPRRDHSNAIRR